MLPQPVFLQGWGIKYKEKSYVYEYDKSYHQEIMTGISITVSRGKKKTKNEIVNKSSKLYIWKIEHPLALSLRCNHVFYVQSFKKTWASVNCYEVSEREKQTWDLGRLLSRFQVLFSLAYWLTQKKHNNSELMIRKKRGQQQQTWRCDFKW